MEGVKPLDENSMLFSNSFEIKASSSVLDSNCAFNYSETFMQEQRFTSNAADRKLNM
jgi:hypothetical protein